jgi:hypothetical protein
MDIIAGGTEAKTKLGEKDCVVTAACIRFDKVTYELTYYHNGKFETIWMNENEFILKNGQVYFKTVDKNGVTSFINSDIGNIGPENDEGYERAFIHGRRRQGLRGPHDSPSQGCGQHGGGRAEIRQGPRDEALGKKHHQGAERGDCLHEKLAGKAWQVTPCDAGSQREAEKTGAPIRCGRDERNVRARIRMRAEVSLNA